MKRSEVQAGMLDAIPIILGYLPLGFAFGVLASEVGLSVFEATMMSVLCFTGAGQYIAIGLMQAGATVMTIILANFLVNLRYTLFATSLVPHFKGKIPNWMASLLSYGLTDETYAISMKHYKQHDASAGYLAGLNLFSHVGWIGSTVLGAVLGEMITNTNRIGLNFALPAMYICLLVLVSSRRNDHIVAMLAAFTALLIGFFFPGTMSNLSNVIIATIFAASLGVYLNARP